MVRLRVKLRGTGKTGDALHVDLPTYKLVDFDIDKGFAYIEVPEIVFPGFLVKDGDFDTVQHLDQTWFSRILPSAHIAWWKHLDRNYVEHKEEYRPEVT